VQVDRSTRFPFSYACNHKTIKIPISTKISSFSPFEAFLSRRETILVEGFNNMAMGWEDLTVGSCTLHWNNRLVSTSTATTAQGELCYFMAISSSSLTSFFVFFIVQQ